MRNDDPWEEISTSPSGCSLLGHLVLESRPHEVFRARDTLGRRMLFLVHDRESATSTKLPTLAGLEVETHVRYDDGRAMLSVHLENEDDADIFTRFCEDIIATVAAAETEASAVQAFVGRTWKWHALLRGARKKVLSREAQLGLIGELYTLLHFISPVCGLGAALEAWRGSEGAPKDFELAQLCIECKARGASSRAKVRITSEHQLADTPGQDVILIVNTFASVTDDKVGTANLHGVVTLLRSTVSSERPDLSEMMENKLDDAGYEEEHDYDLFVVHLGDEAFKIEKDFPRIVQGMYPQGPVEVCYDLPLSTIAPFEISGAFVRQLIKKSEADRE